MAVYTTVCDVLCFLAFLTSILISQFLWVIECLSEHLHCLWLLALRLNSLAYNMLFWVTQTEDLRWPQTSLKSCSWQLKVVFKCVCWLMWIAGWKWKCSSRWFVYFCWIQPAPHCWWNTETFSSCWSQWHWCCRPRRKTSQIRSRWPMKSVTLS